MKLQELYSKLEEIKANAEGLEKAEDIKASIEQIKDIKAQIELQKQLEADKKQEIKNKINAGEMNRIDGKDIDDMKNKAEIYKEGFYNVLRGRTLTTEQHKVVTEINNALSSNTDTDGGYLIPDDQKTAIKELKREFGGLEFLVNTEKVSTKSGSRNIEKDAAYTPFTELTEGNDIPEENSPQFENIPFDIKDRGGILPVPNSLLADETANLQSYLNRWLAKKSIATRNKLIVDLLGTLAKTAIAGINDVKDVLDVQLDPAIKDMAIIVMNQDSFNKFNKMKDNDDNYLLEKDPQNSTRKLLNGKPVYVFSNKILATRDDAGTMKAPVIIGSLSEAITLFDRQAMSLLATKIGGSAFTKNRTEIRAITREDIKFVDSDAIVFGEITL
ncbi:phage major capsid protein [Wukongibacter sp. M2B1]|uniref:phage major capsid protein n=1 Tax=Wukongibacter sp. M2B1 TaxID=3088895 RepID=UPI003D7BC118